MRTYCCEKLCSEHSTPTWPVGMFPVPWETTLPKEEERNEDKTMETFSNSYLIFDTQQIFFYFLLKGASVPYISDRFVLFHKIDL